MSDILNKLYLNSPFDKPLVYIKERDEETGCGLLYTSVWEFFTNSNSEGQYNTLKEEAGPLGGADTKEDNYNRIIDDLVPFVAGHAKFKDPENGIVNIELYPDSVDKFKTYLKKVLDACASNKFDQYMCDVFDERNKGVLNLSVGVGVYCIDKDIDFINAFDRTDDGYYIATFPSLAVLIPSVSVMEKGPDGRDWIKIVPLPE